jgi:WD40 repeat protein
MAGSRTVSSRGALLVCRLLGVGLLAFTAAPVRAQAPGPPASDAHGDPLPDGAVARLGTVRSRALCNALHFSPDGKQLVGLDAGRFVRVWDAATGRLLESAHLPGRPERDQWAVRAAYSADGRVALLSDGPALELWDVHARKQLDVPLPAGRKPPYRFAVSADGRRLLLREPVGSESVPMTGSRFGEELKLNLLLWDTTTGKLRVLAEDEAELIALGFSPDGTLLASSSYKRGTRTRDAATGKLLWSEPKFNAEKVAFTPDSRHLIAAPGGGQSAWHVRDAATGRPAKDLRPPNVGYVWTFAVSPDSRSLLIPTHTDYVVWDLAAGKVVHRWPGANQSGKGVFAADGKSVVTFDTILRRWDLDTGRQLYPDVGSLGHVAPVRRLLFAPDGKRLVSVGDDNTARVWDVPGAKLLHTLDAGAKKIDAWTLTPDGSTLVGVDETLAVRRWSLVDGEPLGGPVLEAARRLDIGLRPVHARVAAHGTTLVLSAWPRSPEYSNLKYSFSFWDLRTGRLVRWGNDPGREYNGEYASVSPDGRLAAVYDYLISTAAGEVRPLGGKAGGINLFSPDGRLMAAHGNVWEVASRRRLLDLPHGLDLRGATRWAAFSWDGRRFAYTAHRKLLVWDLPTRKVLFERTVPEYLHYRERWATSSPAFSRDGRTVATGHTDGTILLWSIPPPAVPEGGLTDAAAAALWDDLAATDPATAWAAVWRLALHRGEAVRLLKTRYAPVDMPSDAELRALVRSLDSPRFRERDAATKRLASLGRAAEETLRQALKDGTPLELRRRIDVLLTALESSDWPTAADLRPVRAVAVLEVVGTADARRVLETWAKHPAERRLADEATAALARSGWASAKE